MNKRVICVGDRTLGADPLRSVLEEERSSLVVCRSGAEARETLRGDGAEVIISEETLSDELGVDLLRFARERRPTCVRMLLLDERRPETLIDAVNTAEIFRFLVPPLTADSVRRPLLEAFVIGRVAEAQEAVWLAAKRQQEAMEGLLAPGRAFAGRSAEGAPHSTRWGNGNQGDGRSASPGLRADLSERLSTRERQIVQLLGAGQRVKDIAVAMTISTHTVRNHLKAIYRKLNVRSQFELLGLVTRS
jgi:DNA-binding NarL/FixJ family response regulator